MTANTIVTQPLGSLFATKYGPTLMSSGGLYVTSDGIEAQYSYSVSALAPVATPTDVIIMQGSATKTIRIVSITIGGAATAAGSMPVTVVRRLSTGGTVGSAVLTAIVPGLSDNLNAAATATISSVGTANYTTVQTSAGNLFTGRVGLVALTSAAVYAPLYINPVKSFLLRGTSDYIAINFSGAAVPSGGVLDITIFTNEDAS